MGKKNKKLNSLDALKNIKIEEDGFIEKSPEEIAEGTISDDKKMSYSITIQDSQYYLKQKSSISKERKAWAPYNFIPLNDKIILSKFNIKSTPFDKYHHEKFTGFIKLNIQTKTPIYLKDMIDYDQFMAGTESKDISDFYSPGDKVLKIPGSSQRGLIRTFVEIVTWGKFDDFEDKRLYMRGFADKTLGPVYRKYGLSSFSDSKGVKYNMNSGVLIKKGSKFFIKDCGKTRQIDKSEAKTRISALGKTYELYEFYLDNVNSEFIVVTGDINSKKHDWIVSYPATKCKQIPLSENDIKDYENDINKDSKTDLLEKLKSYPGGIPCFYTEWKDDEGKIRYSFGHTGMFRVPYNKTIGQHIPDELKSIEYLDFSEAIFGNEKSFAGRVFFEDAVCTEKDNTKVLMGENYPEILSSPKPTTFQHYLTQPEENQDELKHYGADSKNKLSALRGYKQYWHKDGTGWIANPLDVQTHPTQYNSQINPVKSGTTFEGRIRFENLSDVELGALLFALELPEGCYHKIGMGKPLGLGSIEITPTLHLSNRDDRYKILQSEWIKEAEVSNEKGKTTTDFKDIFATYILKALNNNQNNYTANDLWAVDRLNELKIMLDYDKKPTNTETRYMKITPKNEFKNRPVLPKPSDVK